MPRAKDVIGRFAQPRALTVGAAEAMGRLAAARPGYGSTGNATFNASVTFDGLTTFAPYGWILFDGINAFEDMNVFATESQPDTGFFDGRSFFNRDIDFAEE